MGLSRGTKPLGRLIDKRLQRNLTHDLLSTTCWRFSAGSWLLLLCRHCLTIQRRRDQDICRQISFSLRNGVLSTDSNTLHVMPFGAPSRKPSRHRDRVWYGSCFEFGFPTQPCNAHCSSSAQAPSLLFRDLEPGGSSSDMDTGHVRNPARIPHSAEKRHHRSYDVLGLKTAATTSF